MTEGRDRELPFADQIVWPAEPPLRDRDIWERNIAIVKALSAQAHQVTWQNGLPGRDLYTHMPKTYQVGDVAVDFLPHWGQYTIGGRHFSLPETADVPAATVISVLNDDISHMSRDQAHIRARSQRLLTPQPPTRQIRRP